ncbi:MAG: ATP-binding protein [Bacillota bacterium]|nr:ATP-binding protein [Bacillota bacterium]
MKNRIFKALLAGIIFVLVIVGIYHLFIKNSNAEEEHGNYTVEFNQVEREYMSQRDSIRVYVEEDLRYLMEDGKEGYLNEYLGRMLEESGLLVEPVTDRKEADCSLEVVTENLRDQSGEIYFTAPILQINGKLYINKNSVNNERLTGIAMTDRLDQDRLDEITYKGKKISWSFAETGEEALEYARAEQTDLILGDKSAISIGLAGETDFTGVEEDLYSYNVCIITDEEDALYGIINKCVHGMNKTLVSYRAGEKWFAGQAPLYGENDYGEIYILILIVFAAVFMAFFIYYLSNKNLYSELTDRMNKLTESKRELRTTFDGVGHYMAELNLEGEITDINRAFYDFAETDLVNRKIWDVLDLKGKDRDKLKAAVKEIGKAGSLRNMEVKLKRKTLVLDLFPIDNIRGVTEKLLFMAMDVTNERMAERQMLQNDKMIAVGQLAAGVAHEIRNPLGIIRNYCYVLKNMDDEEVKAKAIAHIEKAVDDSGEIINSLLNFSRVSVKAREQIDLEQHVRSLLTLNKNLLKKKNIHLTIRCRVKIEPLVAVESLDMVLMNLVTNATDAMEQEGKLTITLAKDGDLFYIEVEDTGSGIEEDIMEEIFNPFFTTKGKSTGTGLGLYIVYNEVNKMNGEIQVESKPGEGTRFKIVLPLHEKGED